MNAIPERARRWMKRVEILGGEVKFDGKKARVESEIIPDRMRYKLAELINKELTKE